MYVHTTYWSYFHIFLHTPAHLWLSMLNVILLVRAACLWFCKADTFQFCWSAKFSRESGWTKDPRSEVLVSKQHAVGGKLQQAFILYMLFLPMEVELRNRYYIIRWYALPCRANRQMPLNVWHPSPVFFKKNKGCHKILELYRDIFRERCQHQHWGWDSGIESKQALGKHRWHVASIWGPKEWMPRNVCTLP